MIITKSLFIIDSVADIFLLIIRYCEQI